MSSPWGRRMKIRHSDRCAIRSRSIASPAVRAVDRPPRSRKVRQWCRSAPTPADPSASPRRFAVWSGVTPTYGRVSRYGLTAFASSLDHIGPFARSVKDAATVLRVIAGRDACDATSAEAPVPDYAAALDGNVKGLKLGLPREYLKGLASDTGARIHEAVEDIPEAGLRSPRDQPAGHRLRYRELLHYRYSGSQLQSGKI